MANGYSPSLIYLSGSSSFSHGDDDNYLQPLPENIRLSLNMNKTKTYYELELKANVNIPIKKLIDFDDNDSEPEDNSKLLIDAYLDVAKQRIQNEIASKLIIK